MDNSTDTLLDGLKSTSVRLNTSTDKLQNNIADIDACLKELNLGCEAWIGLDGLDGIKFLRLGYAKINGIWGVAIRSVDDEYLFKNAPRRHRIAVIGHIPELLLQLSTVATQLTQDIDRASRKASEILTAMGSVRR